MQWRLTLSGSNGFSENRKDRKDFEFVFIPFGFLESTEGGGYFGVDTASGAPFVGAGNANNIKILSYDVSCYSGQLLPESPFFLSTYLMDTSVSYKLQDNTGVNLEPTFISPTTPSIVISVHTTSDQTIDKLGGLLINLLVYVGE